ncbi:MAG: MFS transporter [Planctomycetales bacterium]
MATTLKHQPRVGIAARCPIYYGWVQVILAAVAMTATLPGRTHGLSLVTEPLLQDLKFDRVTFANLNLAATILGAAMGIVAGWVIDRWGTRKAAVLAGLLLAFSVFGLCWSRGIATSLIALTGIRAFGQSALSVISMAMVGKWFVRRLGMAMGMFALLITIGFIATVLGVGDAVQKVAGPVTGIPPVYAHPEAWRTVWNGIGWWLLIGFVPLAWLFVRDTPESCSLLPDAPARESTPPLVADISFASALRTPAFWVFVLTTGLFNLIFSGVTLFNESILTERGFPPQSAAQCLATVTAGGLLANLIAGAFNSSVSLRRLLGIGMLILAGALAYFPRMKTATDLQMYAIAVGVSGGFITVVFFALWGQLYGRSELGRIQGAAQVITTLSSAAGPLVLAGSHDYLGSYAPAMLGLAVVSAVLTIASVLVPLPKR